MVKASSAYQVLAVAGLVLFLIISNLACSRQNVTTGLRSGEASWAYPFVKWNGHTYVITDETVTETGKLLGTVTKYSTNEHEEFSNSSSNYFPEGTKLYAIAGLDPNQYIAGATASRAFVKAVVREIWEKSKTSPAGQATKKAVPQYDIPWQAGWLTAEQALAKAFAGVAGLQKLGTLVPASIRLTTFNQVAHGGEYLPASTPVWHVVFQADGRAWVPTSGPAVRDPEQSYSHTQVVNTVETALQAESGEQIFEGISGGSLDTALPLAEIKGTIGEQTGHAGDQVTVNTPGGSTINVLLPRGMAAEIVDPATGSRTKLTFWQTLNLRPGTSVKARGLTAKTGDFLAYTLEVAK